MPNISTSFSSTEIQILENGLNWIKEKQGSLTKKLYSRLQQEHPSLKPLLQSMNPESFNEQFILSLDRIIREIRYYGSVISPLKKIWPELSVSIVAPLKPSEWIKVSEHFLHLVSELAEDAWSPALESAWRKAIKTVMSSFKKSVGKSLSTADG